MTYVLSTEAARKALQLRTTTALRVVVAVSIAAACILAFAQARAEAPGDEENMPLVDSQNAPLARASEHVDLALVDLERAFWACERAAAQRGVFGADGIACGNATEQLKLRKFGGDFGALLEWWQDSKDGMHMLGASVREDAAADAAEIFPQP